MIREIQFIVYENTQQFHTKFQWNVHIIDKKGYVTPIGMIIQNHGLKFSLIRFHPIDV